MDDADKIPDAELKRLLKEDRRPLVYPRDTVEELVTTIVIDAVLGLVKCVSKVWTKLKREVQHGH